MGQGYSVTAKLRFRNSNSIMFCQIVHDEIARLSDSATFRQDCDLTTPKGCFEVLTRNQDYDGDVWFADFDASYGWESVLVTTFYAAARGLEDGSYINIDVWDGDGMTHRIEVDDGRVLHTIIDTVDSYDIDDEEDSDG